MWTPESEMRRAWPATLAAGFCAGNAGGWIEEPLCRSGRGRSRYGQAQAWTPRGRGRPRYGASSSLDSARAGTAALRGKLKLGLRAGGDARVTGKLRLELRLFSSFALVFSAHPANNAPWAFIFVTTLLQSASFLR